MNIYIIDYIDDALLLNSSIVLMDILNVLKNDSIIEQRGHGLSISEVFSINSKKESNTYFVPINSRTTICDIIYLLTYIGEQSKAKQNIINMSFGYFEEYIKDKYTVILLQSIIDYMHFKKGFYFVVAEPLCTITSYPASCKNVIRVGIKKNQSRLIESEETNIFFSPIKLKLLWSSCETRWVYGSSYYAPIVTAGLTWIDNKHIKTLQEICREISDMQYLSFSNIKYRRILLDKP